MTRPRYHKATVGAVAVLLVALGLGMVRVWRADSATSDSIRKGTSSATSESAQSPTVETRREPSPAASLETPIASEQAAPLDESALMERLRGVKESDPELAVQIAREGNRRFDDSPDAPERVSILIHALARQGRASEARGEAEDMVNHYPDSSWVREIERFTGAHRHRNVRLTADGSIEFE